MTPSASRPHKGRHSILLVSRVDINFNVHESDGEAARRAATVKAQVEGAVLAARRRLKGRRWALGGSKAQVEVGEVGAWLRQGAG